MFHMSFASADSGAGLNGPYVNRHGDMDHKRCVIFFLYLQQRESHSKEKEYVYEKKSTLGCDIMSSFWVGLWVPD